MGQAERREQLMEAGLAVRLAVALEARQRDRDVGGQFLLRLRQYEALLVDGEQHVEPLARHEREEEIEKSVRILAQARAAVIPVEEAGEATETIGIGIAQLDLMA